MLNQLFKRFHLKLSCIVISGIFSTILQHCFDFVKKVLLGCYNANVDDFYAALTLFSLFFIVATFLVGGCLCMLVLVHTIMCFLVVLCFNNVATNT